MFENLTEDTIIHIIGFLSHNDVYIIKEIDKYFYNIIKFISQYPENRFVNFNLLKTPSINYISTSLNLIEWALEHPSFYKNNLQVAITKNRNLYMLQYVLKIKMYDFNPEVYYIASKNNYYEIFNWCQKENYIPNERAIQGACESGNFELVKWMNKNNFPFDKNACHMAANNNHLTILKFLVKKGYNWDKRIFNYAANNGNISILKYLKKSKL